MTQYRYSRWDGSQEIAGLDGEEILESLADDILADGDLSRALRNMLLRGYDGRQRLPGLRDLIERIRQERQQRLERHDLDSVMDDIEERLKDVVDTERGGIDRRLREAADELAQDSARADELSAAMQVLERRAERSREVLDNLPESPAGAVRQLKDYDFVDSEAHRKFQELLDMLSQGMMDSFVRNMREQLQQMSPEQKQRLNEMLRALNQMLSQRATGLEPDFDAFMDEYGDFFSPNQPQSLDELLEDLRQRMAAMQSLMAGLSPEVRDELESLVESALDGETLGQLGELGSLMQALFPGDTPGEYGFLGDDPITLDQAMELMRQLQDLDGLEQELRQAARNGSLDDLDADRIEELLGEDARSELQQLQDLARQLEEAGLVQNADGRIELTPRGIRKLGQLALKEVFSAMKRDRIGEHELHDRGQGGEHTGETKPLEFGDAFDIDLNRTVYNATIRNGPSVPVRLRVDDMEVHRTEHLTQAATVLLIDQSRSMGMFGSFAAAKKVALALYWLIHTQYPRDYFYVIGFSDYALEIKGDELTGLRWNEMGPGTNMHHAFMLSRRLLVKQKVATRQILMITDGEPTAHLEGEYAYFNYPPSYYTVMETLKEVRRCTKAGITINTFMLASTPYLMDFVDKMTQINRGRAFFTTPAELGSYVMVDYLNARRKRVGV